MMNKVNAGITRAYLAYKNVFSKKDGASTVEYVAVLGAAVMLGGILYTVLQGQQGAISEKISSFIESIR